MATPVFVHGKNTRLIYANTTTNKTQDISGYFNDASVSRAIEATDTTAFQTGGVKTYITGLKEGVISLSGMYEGSTNGLDALLTDAIYTAGDKGVIVFPQGGQTSDNERCYMAVGINTKYDLKSPVSGVVAADTEIQSDGGVWAGRGSFITVPSSGYTTAPRDHTYGQTTAGGLLIMGITSITGGATVSLSFQHSQTGSSWVTPTGGTLATETGVGTAISQLTGTIYEYTRLVATVTGGTNPSATIYFGFARY